MSKKAFLIFPLLLILIVFLTAWQSGDSKYSRNNSVSNPSVESAYNTFTNNRAIAEMATDTSQYTEKGSLFAMTTPFDNPEDDNSNYGDVPFDIQLDIPVDYNPDAIYEQDSDQKVIYNELNDMIG
jgi:hypothetical protein